MAIDRMTRALREYQVLGIRTTIPFFQWLMARAEYREGRYDTTYLDRLLVERRGESFTEIDAAGQELMTIAAGLDAYFRASAASAGVRCGGGRAQPVAAGGQESRAPRMTFEIELGGRSRQVAIEPAGGTRFRVTIDDVEHVVDAVRVGPFGLSLLVDGRCRAQPLRRSGPWPSRREPGVAGRTVHHRDGRRPPRPPQSG